MTTTLSRRAGPLFGAVLVAGALLAAVSPAIPAVSALDPTPNPATTIGPDVTPDPLATPTPAPDVTPEPSVAPTADPTAAPTPDATPQPQTPGLHVLHYWVGKGDKDGILLDAGSLDQPRTDLQPYSLYLVRFQLLNSSARDIEVTPTLRYGAAGSTGFDTVPSLDPILGVPFYVANDEGHTFRTRTTPIAADALRLGAPAGSIASALGGEYSGGPNPAKALMLRAGTYTEIEFGVRATGDAQALTAWAFRLDLGAATVGNVDASVAVGREPSVVVPPNQKAGIRQGGAVPLYRLQQPTPASMGSAGPSAAVGKNPPSYLSPHQQYSLADDSCAGCHSAHRASGQLLLKADVSPVSTLCFQCHDGSGALANVQAQYSNVLLPVNNAATASYYSHPATVKSNHQTGVLDEFAAKLNRHAECIDCHQPHRADATTSTQASVAGAAVGWTAGGPISGATGVAVTNGTGGTAPAYALQTVATFEYQLCFKCHSGYTTLPTRNAAHPSWQALDKAIEFNPANVSFHPVEAKGTNPNFIRSGQTVGVMDQNLAGTSTFKTWTFTSTSTIRCANCHGSSGQTQVPANAGATSDTHASVNRGILLRPYRDRLLKPSGEAFSEAEFALCFMCHTNTPFLSTSSSSIPAASNFRYHGFHTRGVATTGDYLTGDIDTDGAGAGNALCAECHFRMHGSTYSGNSGTTENGRLVNFAPDVQPLNGVLSYTPRIGNTAGSCTLICHTKEHNNLHY